MTAKKIVMIISGAAVPIGFILLVVGNEIAGDTVAHIGAGLSFGGGLVFIVTDYLDKHRGEPLPIKKLLVCAAIMAVGILITALILGAASQASGWTPVGYEVIMPMIPIILSIAACVWYWQAY